MRDLLRSILIWGLVFGLTFGCIASAVFGYRWDWKPWASVGAVVGSIAGVITGIVLDSVAPRPTIARLFAAALRRLTAMMFAARPRRSWMTFSLRTLLVMFVPLSVSLGWLGLNLHKAREQRAHAEAIERLGGRMGYDYENDANGNATFYADRPGPIWLRKLLGDDFFITVDKVEILNNDFTNTDLSHVIAHLKGLPSLKVLLLAGTKVNGVGVAYLQGLDRLETLDLKFTPVTGADLEHLYAFPRLTELRLNGTGLTDEDLSYLNSMVRLKKLVLGNTTTISQAGVLKLKKALPSCEIEHWN